MGIKAAHPNFKKKGLWMDENNMDLVQLLKIGLAELQPGFEIKVDFLGSFYSQLMKMGMDSKNPVESLAYLLKEWFPPDLEV